MTHFPLADLALDAPTSLEDAFPIGFDLQCCCPLPTKNLKAVYAAISLVAPSPSLQFTAHQGNSHLSHSPIRRKTMRVLDARPSRGAGERGPASILLFSNLLLMGQRYANMGEPLTITRTAPPLPYSIPTYTPLSPHPSLHLPPPLPLFCFLPSLPPLILFSPLPLLSLPFSYPSSCTPFPSFLPPLFLEEVVTERIRHTPFFESAIGGIALGLSMQGIPCMQCV